MGRDEMEYVADIFPASVYNGQKFTPEDSLGKLYLYITYDTKAQLQRNFWKALLKAVDVNDNGTLDKEEFTEYVNTLIGSAKKDTKERTPKLSDHGVSTASASLHDTPQDTLIVPELSIARKLCCQMNVNDRFASP